MKILPGKRKFYFHYQKFAAVIMIIVCAVGILASSFKGNIEPATEIQEKEKMDSAASVAAFMKVYDVLMSPRCVNCHPAGDIPLQGDDSQLHNMSPKRGKDGKGMYALKCANCHQPTNSPGLNTPPGNPKWALPPADMKMVFEGRSPRELAIQLMDYNLNGNKNKAQLIEHARDTLVKAGWNMGEGRKPPPLPYEEFVANWDEWINKGGFAPAK